MGMSNVQERKLAAWIRREVFSTRRQGRCVKIVLHHAIKGRVGPEVFVVNVGENLPAGESVTEDNVLEYAAEVRSEAETWAEGLNAGPQSFMVVSYFEDDDTKGFNRFPFTIHVDMPEDDGEGASEPANMQGLLTQLMRHLESKERVSMAAFGSIITTLQKQNQHLVALVEKQGETRLEMVEAMESLISNKHVRDMENRQQENTEKHKSQILDNVIALLPAVGNKIMGRKILPETADPLQLQMLRLLEAMPAEEIDRVFNAIEDPTRKAAFAAALEAAQNLAVKAAEEERQRAFREQAAGNGRPQS